MARRVVLERLARALAEVRRHRVGGVAEQRDPADGERRERAHELRGLDDVDVGRGRRLDDRVDGGNTIRRLGARTLAAAGAADPMPPPPSSPP